MAWFNRERTDQFGNRIHWEDEVDPEANWPAQFGEIAAGNYHRPWVAAAAGGAATLAYWRGHPISEENLPTEEIWPQGPQKSTGSDVVLYDPNNKRTRAQAFPWTSEPRSFERFEGKFQRTDRSSSTIENLLNIGAQPIPKGVRYDQPWGRRQALRDNARRAVNYLTRSHMPYRMRGPRTVGGFLRRRYNRRYGGGKYRRAPRTAGRGFSNRRGIGEKKYLDINIPANTVDSGTIYGTTMGYGSAENALNIMCLNNPPQGDDATSHDGRQIRNISIQIKGLLQAGASQTAVVNTRTLLIWDKCPNGTAPLFSNYLDNSVVPTSTNATYATAPFNLANRERFKILKDYQTDIHPYTVSTVATQSYAVLDDKNSRSINWFIKLKMRKTIFNTNNTTRSAMVGGTAIQSGALYLLTCGDLVGGAATVPKLAAGYTRFRFFDE